MPDAASRKAVEVAEQFADGLVGLKALGSANRAANRVLQRVEIDDTPTPAVRAAAAADCASLKAPAWVAWVTRETGEKEAHAGLLRDLFGNPFRPVSVDAGRLTPSVVMLASAIYDDRAFDRLPILADALEEAGCQNDEILAHCRQAGEHVRGCWPVDLILGKE
jgi:hypothetical protein